ncbi:MAG TPA: response regulator [Gammaproteobacteria bacterium]|nr:response regulator [Gammaproteobacteria bacterium]
MAVAMTPAARKPQVLFVDDEQRVLNSMRIMFRREFDLHLANSGKEALDIIGNADIDVIVADHRMPQMTGVEVLTQVRSMSPRTVRILLTGYADLDAVEGSINDGEVFRFLTKPCPPDQLRNTVALAVKVAQQRPASAPEPEPEPVADLVPETTPAEPRPPLMSVGVPAAAASAASRERLAQGLGIVVFTTDEEVLSTVQHAVRGRLPVYSATNIVKVVKILTEHRPGVLLTDISDDKATIQSMTARLKEHLPELVTIAVSLHRDVLDMVWLINHGQIFRFLRKPLSPGRCAVSLQAALKHHRMLLKNPDMVQRYKIEASDESGLVGGVMAKLRNVRRLWASA